MEKNELIKAVINYKRTRDDQIFEIIIEYFTPCIKYYVDKIEEYYRDDLMQELLNAIYNAIIKFSIKTNDCKSDFEIESISKLKKYNDIKINKSKLLFEYQLFINENQFKKYVNKTCQNTVNTFYKKVVKNQEKQLSLNKIIVDNVELVDLIYEEKKKYKDLFEFLNSSDKNYILNFVEGTKLLKNKEVAQKLGVSPAAVSKRVRKIKEKIKKRLIFQGDNCD